MRFPLRALAAGIALAQSSIASIQELSDAIEKFPELFMFHSLLEKAPSDVATAFDGKEKGVTVLVPTNDAVSSYLVSANITTLDDVDAQDLKAILEYHVMDAPLKSDDFDDPRGAVVPTRLTDEKFNNRTAGELLRAKFGDTAFGQVVFALKEKNSRRTLRARQDADALTGPIVQIRAGLEQNLKMTAVDGTWGEKNTFQVVDKVLVPPRNCSTTIRAVAQDRLKALDKALTKVDLWPTLNTAFNVTCLAPTSDAFRDAGSPQDGSDNDGLRETLLLHTLQNVAYTNYLEHGMKFKSLNNLTIHVTIKDGDMFFNNAKVVEPNVLTNNGLVHILDAVIKKSNETDDDDASSTGPSSSSTDDKNGARSLSRLGASFAVVLLVGFALL